MADVTPGTLLIPSGSPGLPGPRGEQGPPGPAGSKIDVGPIAPPEPHEIGDLWFDTTENQLKMFGIDLDWILVGGVALPLAVESGGTNADNAADARANLGAVGPEPDTAGNFLRTNTGTWAAGVLAPVGNVTRFGDNALPVNTGIENTAFGFWALASNTVGRHNVAVGTMALALNESGLWNVAMGHEALQEANHNDGTAIGSRALGRASGGNNTAIGSNAGRRHGSGTGAQNLLACDNSVFVGAFAYAGLPNQTNEIVIGYAATGRGSNTATIGNADVTQLWLGNTQITPFPEAPNDGFVYARRGSNASWQGLTRADENTALGEDALAANTAGSQNTAVGTGALNLSTSGHGNTAIGVWSLYSNTVGGDNVAVGDSALGYMTESLGTVAIGKGAGTRLPSTANLVSGNNSIFIGFSATAQGNAQNNQIVIGANAVGRGSNTATVGNNEITGFYSSNIIVVDAARTALGTGALAAQTTGIENTAVGFEALNRVTTLSQNTAVGFQALRSMVGAGFAQNTAVGAYAMTSTTNATRSTAVGTFALRANTSGTDQVAVGMNALAANTTGNSNVAVGSGTLPATTTGSNNVVVGSLALNSAAGLTGNNVVIGMSAGRTFSTGTDPVTMITSSVLIGHLARPAANSDTNEIAIGQDVIGHGSNTATIGNDDLAAVYSRGMLELGMPTGPEVSGPGNVNISGNFFRNGVAIPQIPEPTGGGIFFRQIGNWTNDFTGNGPSLRASTTQTALRVSAGGINAIGLNAEITSGIAAISVTHGVLIGIQISGGGTGVQSLSSGTGVALRARPTAAEATGIEVDRTNRLATSIRIFTWPSPLAAETSGAEFGNIAFAGFSGGQNTSRFDAASIRAVASQNWASGANGGELQFQVTQNGTATRQTAVTVHNNGNMTVVGTVTANGVTLTSDPVLKKDIRPARPGALKKVLKIPVIDYRWSANTDSKLHRGFSAPDIARVMGEDSGFSAGHTYSLADMNALLWQAVQELSAEVTELRSR